MLDFTSIICRHIYKPRIICHNHRLSPLHRSPDDLYIHFRYKSSGSTVFVLNVVIGESKNTKRLISMHSQSIILVNSGFRYTESVSGHVTGTCCEQEASET